MKKQTAIFFYVLSAYVVLQFLWWGYHLIDLSNQLVSDNKYAERRIIMIIGEGAVFFLILLLGIWKIKSAIRKDIQLSNKQSNFLLSVTHELKTPLASNKLYLQTLLKRTQLPEEKRKELINQAITENNRLEAMIENILTATRIENHKLELIKSDTDLSQLISDTVKKWSKERAEVTLNIEENMRVKVDAFIIETVLINLLENALKYGGDNSKIEVYLKKEGLETSFGVIDDGIGIPEKFKNQIFEKFTRIGNEETRKQKGTGLGLYIVAQLLELHNMEIECLPNKPQGTNFKITYTNEG